MKYLAVVIATLSVVVLASAPAHAHGHLERATPAVGSTVAQAPKEVVLVFSSKLEPAFSSIEVRSMTGAAMQAGKAAFDPGDGTQMRVPLKPLAPGTYKVIWRVLSVDTHRTQGDFTFKVGP
jgi:methionine-rich copper-binding protein CopC